MCITKKKCKINGQISSDIMPVSHCGYNSRKL